MHSSESHRQILESLIRKEITKEHAKADLRWSQRSAPVPQSEPIAIIGIAGRYPGANSIDELWDVVKNGKNSVSPIGESRWPHHRYFDQNGNSAGKTHSTHAGFLDEIDCFDALLFKVAPRDAEVMDPQIRIFLETAWSTFENAGYPLDRLSRIRQLGARVGVFVGACFQQYQHVSSDEQFKADNLVASFGALAGRVSNCFDLNGPSLAVDTACSSSMMALHYAICSLLAGECQMALAGGVNLTEHPFKLIGLKHLVSGADRSRPFAGGDGYISSEGVGAVLLKPLSRAVEDGDFIHATILGSAVGHAGKGGGYCVPNADEQLRIMGECLARAGMTARSLDYVECAALGSSDVDGAEFAALSRIFAAQPGKRMPVGTVKGNIGHCEAASTMAQLTKVLLQFRHRSLAPTINATPSLFDFSTTALKLQLEATICEDEERESCALINSTGAAGAYGSLVLREYPLHNASPSTEAPALIPLSAGREDLIGAQAAKLGDYLSENPAIRLCDVAFTMQTGRNHLRYRVAMVAASCSELIEMLKLVSAQGTRVLDPRICSDHARDVDAAMPPCQAKLEHIAAAWCGGARITWPTADLADRGRRVPLPSYVFHRRHCWASTTKPTSSSSGSLRQRSSTKKSVVVIGAGPAGLAAAKCLQDEGLEPIVLEQTDRIAGIWTFRDNYASGPYKSTRTQNSKFTFFLSDFPPLDSASLFCGVNEVKGYLNDYASHFGLGSRIGFNSRVLQVEKDQDEWRVTYHNPQHGLRQISAAGVFCCSGSFWEPNVPVLSGQNSFRGLQLSGSAYHSSEIFTGKRVLIVGAGVSGADIAAEAAEVAVKCCWSVRERGWLLPRMVGFTPNDCSVSFVRRFLSANQRTDEFVSKLQRALPDYMERYQRTGLLPRDCPTSVIHVNDHVIDYVAQERVIPREALVGLDEHGCYFADGGYDEFDVIVYCTGYKPPAYEYLRPFSFGDFRDGVFLKQAPSLAICNSVPGVGGFGAGWPYFELLARWYAGIVSGRYRAPGDNDPFPAPSAKAGERQFFDSWMESLKVAHALGVLPDPLADWRRYWEFVSMPPIPALFRLYGPLSWGGAEKYIHDTRRKFFLKPDDEETAQVKAAVLAGLGRDGVQRLRSTGQIGEEELQAAAHSATRLAPWLAPVPHATLVHKELALAS